MNESDAPDIFLSPISNSHKNIKEKCYLCSAASELQNEHVIPRIILKDFPKDKKYIILKACNKCNKSKGEIEEFCTRQIQYSSSTLEAQKGMKNAIRGMRNGHGLGIKKFLLDNTSNGYIKSSSGIILGKCFLLKANDSKLRKFFINIAKGLFTYYSGVYVDWNKITIRIGMEQTIQSTKLINSRTSYPIVHTAPYKGYYKGYFSFFGHIIEKHSIWTMTVYNSHIASVSFESKEENIFFVSNHTISNYRKS